MKIEVVTPIRKEFSGEANSVTLPGMQGSFQVLDFHADMISNLKKGKLTIDSKEFAIETGIVKVQNNTVLVLTESVEVL